MEGGLKGYDIAQVCLNGHTINQYARSQPEHNRLFCGRCGERTITQCLSCNRFIRGFYHIPNVIDVDDYVLLAFCQDCGSPYPWTGNKLTAARELIAEVENLKPEEAESLNKSLDDLVRDTPSTQLAAIRFKKFLPKAGKEIAEGLRKIIVDIASEAAKKALFP